MRLQRGEKLKALADIEAVIELAVDDQRRRLEILRERCGDHLSYISRLVYGVPLNSQLLNQSSSVVP